jgi:hypothetical protein
MTHRMIRHLLVLAVAAGAAATVAAGEADIVDAKVRRSAAGVYDFDVTIRSVDKGWDYYADSFEVLTPDGRLLGQRELLHPHETEQPFTRELYGVRIPASVTEVLVRARHKPRGYDGATRILKLPR